MFFDTVRHQLFDGQLWCPLFLLSLKIFDARSFLQHSRDHLQSFSGNVRQKISSGNYWYPLSMQKMLWYQIFSETRKGLPYEIFRYCETKILIKKSDTSTLLLSIKISDTRNFLKQRRVPLRNFSVLWDKDFDKKSWYTPLVSYP